MSKNLTKTWLRGLRRLVATQIELPRVPKARAPARITRVKTAVAVGIKAKTTAKPRESRVRPRASAWATGKWSRSFHSSPPTAGRFVNHLAYALYLPATPVDTRLPLVVMLHGCKQSAEEFAQGTRMNLLADRYGFAVLYPEQSKTAHPHGCWRWYDGASDGGTGEAAAIASLIRAMTAQNDFDAERIYLTGMSAGAGLAAMLAVSYPSMFAAVGLHSGVVFGDASSAIGAMDVMRRGTRQNPLSLIDKATNVAAYPGIPAVIVHGELDSVVSKVNADQLTTEFLRLNHFIDENGNWRAGERKQEVDDNAASITDYVKGGRRVVRTCIVRGLGHAWSGGDDTVPFHSSRGPDASALFWEFFKHQRRVQNTVGDETTV